MQRKVSLASGARGRLVLGGVIRLDVRRRVRHGPGGGHYIRYREDGRVGRFLSTNIPPGLSSRPPSLSRQCVHRLTLRALLLREGDRQSCAIRYVCFRQSPNGLFPCGQGANDSIRSRTGTPRQLSDRGALANRASPSAHFVPLPSERGIHGPFPPSLQAPLQRRYGLPRRRWPDEAARRGSPSCAGGRLAGCGGSFKASWLGFADA